MTVPAGVRRCPAPTGLTLTVRDEAALGATVIESLTEEFALTYSKLICYLDGEALTRHPAVTLVVREFGAGDVGVAHALSGQIDVSAAYLRAVGSDPGMLTHELVHVVQDYPQSSGSLAWWWVEGIADYLRFLYTPANARWRFESPTAASRYTEGYRVTARFLWWLERRRPGVVGALHELGRLGIGGSDPFVQLTGRSTDSWWQEYLTEEAV